MLQIEIRSQGNAYCKSSFQDRLINEQIGVVKHLEVIENKSSIIYTKFENPDVDKKLITKYCQDS